jgi:hypothetical protein
MKRALLVSMMVANALLGQSVIAQAPQDDRRTIPPRSIQLTVQEEHVIRENIKDLHIEPIAHPEEFRIGEKLSSGIDIHDFPVLVVEKVPKVKAYKFFVTEKQIMLVGPQKDIADIIKLAQ